MRIETELVDGWLQTISLDGELDAYTGPKLQEAVTRALDSQLCWLVVDLLKVDVPADATPDTAWEVSRQSRKRYFVALPLEGAPLGEPVRFDYTLDPFTSEPGTDTHVLAYRQRVSVTPLSFDLTARTDLEALG